MTSVLRLASIAKSFSDERGTRQLILPGVSLSVEAGEIVWLRGESGSGKSTILNISGLLSTPDAGKVWINGNDRTDASSRTASLVRSSEIGMVFQSSNLLPELTALENVLLASRQPLTRATITAQLGTFCSIVGTAVFSGLQLDLLPVTAWAMPNWLLVLGAFLCVPLFLCLGAVGHVARLARLDADSSLRDL